MSHANFIALEGRGGRKGKGRAVRGGPSRSAKEQKGLDDNSVCQAMNKGECISMTGLMCHNKNGPVMLGLAEKALQRCG